MKEITITPCIPAKLRKKLTRLHDSNYLESQALEDINTLADAADNPEHVEALILVFGGTSLAGFVPNTSMMLDTARLALKLGRKVNLTWSQRRWQEEHDKLSRYQTLVTLAAENSRYPLPIWAVELAFRDWPGYLIRSRRRLGMEGLRQCHCIALWDDKCRRGSNVVAVVFIDKVRWTVDILEPGVCGAIHTRFNQQPNADTRASIVELLGIKERSHLGSMPPRQQVSVEDLLNEFMTNHGNALRQQGVKSLSCQFYGSSDDGNVEYPIPYNTLDQEMDISLLSNDARKLLHDIAYEALERRAGGWEINEGSSGSFSFNLDTLIAELDINHNYIETDNETFQFDIEEVA